jgi:hypothetical protein
VKSRIREIREQRAKIAEAARMQPAEIIKTLREYGIQEIADFFVADERGALRIKDLRGVKAEAATAFVRLIRRAFGLPVGFDRVVPGRLIAESGIVDQDLRSRLEARVDQAEARDGGAERVLAAVKR